MKYLFQKYISSVWKINKIVSYTNQESASTNQNARLVYKYVPIRRKNKVSSGRSSVWKWKKKKWFPLARKSVSTSRNKVIFQKLDFPYTFH